MPLSPRAKKRWLKLLIVLIATGSLALWIHQQLKPEVLTPILLSKIGETQQLEIRTGDKPSYALRPEPRLVLSDVQVKAKGSEQVWLRAKQVEISLPWNTLTGGEPVITRLELIEPVVDLPAMFAWLDAQPKTDKPLSIPQLTDGLMIKNGVINDKSWSLQALNAELPELADGSATSLTGKAVLRVSDKDYPFELNVQTTPRADGKFLRLDQTQTQFKAQTPLPNLVLQGDWRFGSSISFNQTGQLLNWPADWPQLPAPINQQKLPYPLSINYAGANNFSDVLKVALQIPEHPVQAELRIPALQGWLTDTSTPLPPLNARYATKKLDMDGVVLSDIKIEITDEESGDEAPSADDQQR